MNWKSLGNPRAAVKALIVANTYLESEVERLRDLMSRACAQGEGHFTGVVTSIAHDHSGDHARWQITMDPV